MRERGAQEATPGSDTWAAQIPAPIPRTIATDAVSALRERLSSLGAGLPASPRRPPPRARIKPAGFEEQETPYGVTLRREEILPEGRLQRGRPAPELQGLSADDFAYLDTETTGLSGGTGTYAFACAVARPHRLGIELIQLLLLEPAAEPAFLFAVDQELRRSPGLATYNGATFDLPLLRTRWTISRLPGELSAPAHLDLLHLGRSLLRHRLGICTLRNVEDRLLGFEREGDIAGELIPRAYFDFLHAGWSPELEQTLSHNRQDVLSLQHLLHRLLVRLRGDDPAMDGDDWLALARHLLRRGRRSAGWRALRVAADLGEPAALQLLARRKAVVLEWRLRRPAAALRVVEAALARLGSDPDLERRRLRLRRRLDHVQRRNRRPQHGAQTVAFADQAGESLDHARVVGLARLLG